MKKAVQHLCMYLSGTSYEGILLKKSVKGTSVFNVDGVVRNENDMRHHVMEVVCDADHAGNRATRKSLSSVHIYLDGNLMESYVRCQKSIALLTVVFHRTVVQPYYLRVFFFAYPT